MQNDFADDVTTVVHSYRESVAWTSGIPDLYIYNSGGTQEVKHEARHLSTDARTRLESRALSQNLSELARMSGLPHGSMNGLVEFLQKTNSRIRAARLIQSYLSAILDPPISEPFSTDLGRQFPLHAEIIEVENSPNAREVIGWITHIVTHYETLGTTRFLQGHPFDHTPVPVREILRVPPQDNGFSCIPFVPMDNEVSTDELAASVDACGAFVGSNFRQRRWAPGAQFIATGERLRSVPRETWTQILEWAKVTVRSGEVLERCWGGLLLCNPPAK